MDYDYFTKKLGCRFDIVEGELVEAENGKFLVTTDFVEYAICLNPITKTWNVIAPKKSYLARRFVLRQSDCLTLSCEWLDDHFNQNFSKIYTSSTRKQFYERFKVTGIRDLYLNNGFYTVNEPKLGDVIFYNWNMSTNTPINHVGIYQGNNKILQQVPYKLSSIDECDSTKITEIFRYASNT